MAGEARSRGQGKEMVVALGVAGRMKGDGAKSTGTESVRRRGVVEKLVVRSEFKMEAVLIWRWRACDDGIRADGRGDTVGSQKYVQTPNDVGDHGRNEQLGESAEREAVCAGADALQHSAVGLLNFSKVAIGGDDFEM